LGGTVFADRHASDNCFGLSGVAVRLTGADGQVFEFFTNEAGNFYQRGKQSPIALPYTASIFYDGVETAMVAPQTNTDCGTCHSREGASLAPGRISPNQLLMMTTGAVKLGEDAGFGALDAGPVPLSAE
jgi:hypothetical protein